MNTAFYIADFEIDIESGNDRGQKYANAYCPICGKSEDSLDHGYGEKYAILTTKMKMRTHFKLSHNISDDNSDSDLKEYER